MTIIVPKGQQSDGLCMYPNKESFMFGSIQTPLSSIEPHPWI